MLNPFNIIKKFIKSNNQKELDRIKKIVSKVNDYEDKITKLNEQEHKLISKDLINKLKHGSKIDDLIPEAYSAVREASKRINNERHFDVQIIGGVVLHENKIAEMKTGEGKTLTIALAAYLIALN